MTAGAFLVKERLGQGLWRSVLSIVGVIGVLVLAASSAPLAPLIYGCWFGLWVAAIFASRQRTLIRYKLGSIVAFCLASLALCLAELPYLRSPRIAISDNARIYVLGDSISAGMGTPERTWPSVLGDISKLDITNLAQPGATTASALIQAQGIASSGALVLIEIGGNDMLGGTSSARFRDDLEKLLIQLQGNRLVMFELPLLPFHGEFGRAQRSLAMKYGVTLIPKHYLAGIIGAKGATLDGLHLSQAGHNELAKQVNALLRRDSAIILPPDQQ